MREPVERLIPRSITLEIQLPVEARTLMQDLHNDRQALGIGGGIALALFALAVLRYVVNPRK